MPATQLEAALRLALDALMLSALRCVRGAVDMGSTPGPAVRLACYPAWLCLRLITMCRKTAVRVPVSMMLL